MIHRSNALVFSFWILALCNVILAGNEGADELGDTVTSHGRLTPQHAAAYVGGSVKLTCESDIPVIWRKLDESDIDLSRHVIDKNSLILHDITMEDNGTYYCYGLYNGIFFKDFADIFVGVENRHSLYIKERKTVSLYCPAKNGTAMWYGNSLKTHPISYGNRIVLDVAPQSGGVVHCYGYNEEKQHYFISEVILRVHKSKFITPRISVKKVNDYHEIYCKTSLPAYWKHNGKALPDGVRVIPPRKIVIKKVSSSHRGSYTCEGRTENGLYFYSTSILNLIFYNEMMVQWDPFIRVSKGKKVFLLCTAPDVKARVTWIHNRPGPLRNNTHSYSHHNHSYVLDIYNVTKHDSGNYWCYAEYDNLIEFGKYELQVKESGNLEQSQFILAGGGHRSNVKQLHISLTSFLLSSVCYTFYNTGI